MDRSHSKCSYPNLKKKREERKMKRNKQAFKTFFFKFSSRVVLLPPTPFFSFNSLFLALLIFLITQITYYYHITYYVNCCCLCILYWPSNFRLLVHRETPNLEKAEYQLHLVQICVYRRLPTKTLLLYMHITEKIFLQLPPSSNTVSLSFLCTKEGPSIILLHSCVP